jgi:3-isopropylmalate/(R)-2-methylmalate dehydratase small subunit
MEKVQRVEAVAMPLDQANCDTDQVVPARFLRKPRKVGYGQFLFHDLRFNDDGSEKPDFVLNKKPFRGAKIIVADRNFGCGSSREHAVWALYDYGFRAAIAPSFGDIFFNNSFQNGFLPVVLSDQRCAELRRQLRDKPGATMTVDLDLQTVTAPDGTTDRFEIEPFRKQCLLMGVDDIGFTLAQRETIAAFAQGLEREMTWLQTERV